MKKWSHAVFFLLAACTVLLFCMTVHGDEENKSAAYYYYYLNKDASALERAEYQNAPEDPDEVFQDLMIRFGSRSKEEKNINLLPDDVIINAYEQDGPVLVIDFNSQYTKMARTREVLCRAGIVRTFVQFPWIDAVRFTVIGEELLDSRQRSIGDMNEMSFLEYSGTQDQSNYRQEVLTLYFADADGTGLIEEKRKIFYKPNLQKERVVLEQLIKGPMEKSNYPTLSDGISVLSTSVAENVCYVSLTDNFLKNAPGIREDLVIYSMVNSLIDTCGFSMVEFTVEGNKNVTFGDSMSLYQFFEKNEDLILKEEQVPEE